MNDIISLTCINSGFGNYGGGVAWTPGGGPTWIDCALGQAQSSSMAVWAIPGSGIDPGQQLQQVRFTGQHCYIVDQGGAFKTRVCRVYGGPGLSPNNIAAVLLGSTVGTGTGSPLDTGVAGPLGLTSDQYNNNQLFVGVYATTDGADSFFGGLYNFEALNVTLYFGVTPPTDPHAPAGHFTNPVGNTDPGKRAGVEQFEAVKFTMRPPEYGTRSTRTWTLRNRDGLLFTSNGTRTLVQEGVFGYDSSCSKISIPADLAPGQYPLTLAITNIDGNTVPNNLTQTTYLTVRRLGGMFMEA